MNMIIKSNDWWASAIPTTFWSGKIHPNACPVLVPDLYAREHGIRALAFGKSYSLGNSKLKIFNHMLDSECSFVFLIISLLFIFS